MEKLGQVYASQIHLARGKTDYQVMCDASVGDMDPLICHHQEPVATIIASTRTHTNTHYIGFSISFELFLLFLRIRSNVVIMCTSWHPFSGTSRIKLPPENRMTQACKHPPSSRHLVVFLF